MSPLPSPRFDPTVTLGNLLTSAAMVAALVTGWSSLSSEQRSQAERIAYIEQRISAYEAAAQQREGRLRTIEITMSAGDARYTAILGELQRINAWIERQDAQRGNTP